MIFTVKNADFSANRIGLISVPVTYETKTDEVLTAYDNTSLTTSQKDELNVFIKGLTDSGIFSKLSHLYLPILAPTLDKALVNIAKPTNPVDAIPSSTAFALDTTNGGIYNANPGTALNITISSSENLSNADFHYLAFNTNIVLSHSAYPAIMDSSASNVYLNFTGGTTSDLEMSSNTKVGGTNLSNLFSALGNKALYKEQSLKGISLTSLDQLTLLRRSLVSDFPYNTPIASETLIPNLTLSLSGISSARMLSSQGLISMGKGLSTAELEIYNTLANDFMTAMGVNVYSI